MMSFLEKHSWAAAGEETTTTGRKPSDSDRIGPYLCERSCSIWWNGSFRRWRWPITGREGGPGGRFLWSAFLNFKIRSRAKMRTNNGTSKLENNNVSSILECIMFKVRVVRWIPYPLHGFYRPESWYQPHISQRIKFVLIEIYSLLKLVLKKLYF